jgi:ketosteroid isomerase-like protein
MHRRSFLSGAGTGLASAALLGAGIAVRTARPVRPGAAEPRASVSPTPSSAAANTNADDGLPGIATIAGPVEHRVTNLPAGPLYWQIETFPTFAEANAAATPYSMTLDAEGRGWLFTLGHQGDQTSGATHLAEIGPLPVPEAPEYLLQLSYQSRAGRVIGTEHTHPGVESWYMFAGEQTVQFPTLEKEASVSAGQGLMGPPANTPLRIVNTSPQERRAFNLFVLDYSAPTQDTGASVATVDAAFKQSFQAGDLDATMALFAPETVEISPFGVFPGKDAIRRSVETFIKANPGLQVSFTESQIVENTSVHHVTLTSDAISKAGVARVTLIHTLVVSRGKIVMLAQQLDLSDPETARFSIGLAPQGR